MKDHFDYSADYYFKMAVKLQEAGYFLIASDRPHLALPTPHDIKCAHENGQIITALGPGEYKHPFYIVPGLADQQPKLVKCSAELFPGFLKITNTETGETLDFDTDKTDPEEIANTLNYELREIGWCVIAYTIPEPLNRMTLENDSAQVYVISIVLDPVGQEIVAVNFYADSDQVIKAISASMMTFNKPVIKLDKGEDVIYVNGAGRRYRSLDTKIPGTNLISRFMFHPYSGLAMGKDFVYVIYTSEDELKDTFYNVLDRVIPHAMLPSWSPKLIQAGLKEGLVVSCTQYGNMLFALKVSADADKWEKLINALLRSHSLSLPT